MTEYWGRRGSAERNQLSQSCSELLGIAEGLLADERLCDSEIRFLARWLDKHGPVSCEWPGDVLHARVKAVLADGVVTDDERAFLVDTLKQIVGGTIERMVEQSKVNGLSFDRPASMKIHAALFCFTGEFVFAPRAECESAVTIRGGSVQRNVTQKLTYLVVGGLGSDEWKHGSFGTKISKAIDYQRRGHPLLIVHEDAWANALREHPTLP